MLNFSSVELPWDLNEPSDKLITIRGRQVGKMSRLAKGDSMLGSDPRCAVIIEGEGVSGLHARIERGPEGCVLNDNDSTHGVFVNGERVRRHVRQDGDRVHMGSETILKFVSANVTEDTPKQRSQG